MDKEDKSNLIEDLSKSKHRKRHKFNEEDINAFEQTSFEDINKNINKKSKGKNKDKNKNISKEENTKEKNIENNPQKKSSENINQDSENSQNSEKENEKTVEETEKIKNNGQKINLNFFSSKKKLIIISLSILAVISIIFIYFPFMKSEKEIVNNEVDEILTIENAIKAIYTFDKDNIAPYFMEFDEKWLEELDFTSNLADSEDLKKATNLAQLEKVKIDLIKTVLLKDVKLISVTEDESTGNTLVSFKGKAVKLEEVTKNIAASLLSLSIENSKNELTVDEIVNAYIDTFKTISKTKYTTTEENMTVEMKKVKGQWVIVDFRKFINTMIPDGDFYHEYMESVNNGTPDKDVEEKTTKENVADVVKDAK